MCGLNDYKFCYHESLPIAGNCRICLIEIEEMDKQVAACVSNVEPNSSIWTENVFCKKARENVVETLLINHPLDCPICDQGGDCDLQDQVRTVGGFKSRFFFNKRVVKDKNCGLFIKTIMTRCIHCLRCVRFNKLVGARIFGVLNRSNKSEIAYHSFGGKDFDFKGVTVDLCPVGALTSRSYSFKCRPWELKLVESLDLTDSIGANLYINFKEIEIFKISPKSNFYVNGNIISDRIRFSLDSINFNRTKIIFKQNIFTKNYERINWSIFLKEIKNDVSVKEINFLINSSLDLETMFYLKKIAYKYCNKIKVYCVSMLQYVNSHVYLFSSFLFSVDAINDCCFFFGIQPKIECSILNLKLRLKYKKSLISVFGFGRYFSDNFEINFLILNIKKVMKLLESKLNSFSKRFNFFFAILIFFSKSFFRNIFDLNVWSQIIKNKLISLRLVEITASSNFNGLKLSNISSILKQKICSLLFCVNLEDNLKLRHVVISNYLKVYWFTTHKPLNVFLYKYIIPISSFLESESYFINVENKIQKTQRVLSSTPSIYNLLKSIFNLSSIKVVFSFFFLNYLLELVMNFNRNLNMFFPFENLCFNNFKYGNKTTIKLSIFKSSLENNFCSNIWTKNSNFLNLAYNVQRKNAQTFFVAAS